MNATASSYDFEWRKVDEEPKDSHAVNTGNYFRCVTQKGTVLSGKKYEVVFEYSPE